MNKIALLIVTLALLGLAQACTVTGPTTGQTGQALTFTVTGLTDGGTVQSKACGGGVTPSTSGATSFSCTYASANNYTVTATEQQSESPTPITCTSLQTTISSPAPASNQPPTVSISSPTAEQQISPGTPFSISGSASDSDGSVALVEVQVSSSPEGCGDNSWQPATLSGSGGSVTWSRSWTPPAGKRCIINVHSRDNGGLQSPDVSVVFNTQAASSSGGSSAQCIASCTNRAKTICPSGAVQAVQCCSVSDCSDTCVGTQYRSPISCSASNTCSYGALSSVAGRCGYNPTTVSPTCRITGTAGSGSSVIMSLSYSSFSTAVGSVSLNCGNGQTQALTCSGTSGTCTASCTYNSAGTFSPSASIQGTSCSSFSLTATGAPSGTRTTTGASSGGTTTTTNQTITDVNNNQQTNQNANRLTCSVNSLTEAHIGDRVNVAVQYSGASLSPGVLIVSCGNGRSATAPGCTSNVLGQGSCTTSCSYDTAGTYVEGTSIRGVACNSNTISITAASSNSLQNSLGFQFTSQDANISIANFATTPRTVLENSPTQITALVQSDQPIRSVTCTAIDASQSSCSCTLASTTIVNPVVDCTVQPPVKGRYQLTFTNTDGKTKNAQITLVAGQAGSIEVINRGSDSNTFYAAIAVAALLIAYAGYFAYTKITAALTSKQKLYERRSQIMKQIEFAKVSFMKGELGQDQFQKMYSNKQQELTETNAKIAEMEKQKK